MKAASARLEISSAFCDWPLTTTSLLFTPPQFLSRNTASSSSSLRPLPSSRCERKYHLEPDSHQQQKGWRALTKPLPWNQGDAGFISTTIYNKRGRTLSWSLDGFDVNLGSPELYFEIFIILRCATLSFLTKRGRPLRPFAIVAAGRKRPDYDY